MSLRALASSFIAILSVLVSTSVVATAQRTFVASYGNDANACTLVSPCRAFAAAVAQTLDNGEVIVLDSAGYGPVAITQSISIIAPPGIYAGISVGSLGLGVNASGEAVTLRGLTITNTASYGSGIGIAINGGNVLIDRCVVTNFQVGTGISIQWYYSTVTIVDSIVNLSFTGITIIGQNAKVNIANSRITRNITKGIEIIDGNPGATNYLILTDTLVTGDHSGFAVCVSNASGPGTTGNISATRVTVNGCAIAFRNGPHDPYNFPDDDPGTTTVGNSTVTGNDIGFLQITGTFLSLGNNQLSNNGVDTSGVITTIGGK